MGIFFSSARLSTGLLCGVLLLFFSSTLRLPAQDDVEVPEDDGTSNFELTGTSFIEAQVADQQGVGSTIPARYARWFFTPTAVLFDIPFTGSLLLSTEQSRGRQSINSVNLSFSLDQEQLQARLRDRLISRISSAPFAGTIDEVESLGSIEEALSDPERIAEIDRLERAAEEGTATGEEIEELREKQAEMAELQRQYEKLKTIREKVGEAEDLRRVAETGYASEKMYDPDNLRGALTELDMLSGVERFLYNFPRFGIGVNYPYYTPFVMNGVAVNGLDVVFNPGQFYLATTVGTAKRDVPEALANDTTYIAFDRTLYAGRIGYGREGQGRFIISTLYAGDEESSVIVDTATGFFLAPQENWVLGFDMEVPIVPEYFSIVGEAAGSLLTGDLTAPSLDSGELNAPAWLTDAVGFTSSSYLDYALAVRPTLTITSAGTILDGTVEYIGPGYVTLGIPYLRNDLFRYEGRLRQRLVSRQVSLDLRYRRDRDNLLETKASTTETEMIGIGVGLTFRNLPFLRVNYTPYRQINDQTGEFRLDNRITVLAATLGHRYRIGNSFSGMTTGTYLLNDVKTFGALFDSKTTTYIVTQLVTIGTDLTLTATGSLSNPTSVVDTLGKITTIDIGGNLTFLGDWNGALGGVLIDEEGGSARTGFYAGLYIPIDAIGSAFELRAERNLYDAAEAALTGERDSQETILRGTVQTTW